MDTAMGYLFYASHEPGNYCSLLQSMAEGGRGLFRKTEMELAENTSRNSDSPVRYHTLGWGQL